DVHVKDSLRTSDTETAPAPKSSLDPNDYSQDEHTFLLNLVNQPSHTISTDDLSRFGFFSSDTVYAVADRLRTLGLVDRNRKANFNWNDAGIAAGFEADHLGDLANNLESKGVFAPLQPKHQTTFTPEGREIARELAMIPTNWSSEEQRVALERFKEWRKSREP